MKVEGPQAFTFVMLASIFAVVGPLLNLISSRGKGSIGGTSSSGIPSFSLGLSWFTDSMMHEDMFGSEALHSLM